MSIQHEHIERIRKEKFWLDNKGNLIGDNPLIDDLMNSIRHLSEELYSKDVHFVFELIQNAEDNEYKTDEPSLKFRLLKDDPTKTPGADGALVIYNNELGFSPENVDAICSIGKTTKTKNRGYIGEKGIGFKSVFRITTTPYIFSNGYQFRLPEKDLKTGLGYIVPEWVINIPPIVDRNKTTIILPLDKGGFDYKKIEEMLKDIEPETILFLTKLNRVEIETDGNTDFVISKYNLDNHWVKILVKGVRNGNKYAKERQFLLFNKTVYPSEDYKHETRKNVDETEIVVAFPIDYREEDIGKIFAYLPVRSGTGFPFIINGDFILPSSREDILDIPWNRWLIREIAELTISGLHALRDQDILTVRFLNDLAKGIDKIKQGDVFYAFVDVINNALTKQKLLPSFDGDYIPAEKAKLASVAGLRTLLSPKQLIELFSYGKNIKWLSGDITRDKTPELYDHLVRNIGVGEITPSVFINRITKEFLEKQSDEWMIRFYRFLNKHVPPWYYSTLNNISFIRLQNGEHDRPFNGDGSPNVFLPPSHDTVFPIVKRNLVEDEEVDQFFKKLGITQPDIVDEVIKCVLPKYESHGWVDKEEHSKDIKKIFKAYTTDSYRKKKFLKNRLIETPFVMSYSIEGNVFCKPKEVYFSTEELKIYFSGNSKVCFLSEIYKEPYLEMLRELGVSDHIRVQTELKDEAEDVELEPSGGYRKGLKGFDPYIEVDGIIHAVSNPNLERSRIVWNKIAVKYKKCIRGKIIISSRRDFSPSASIYREEDMVSNFGKLLINNAWIPDKDGILHRPDEIGLEDLPEGFIRDQELTEQLGMKKDVIAKLAHETGIPLSKLDQFTEIINFLKNSPEEIDTFYSQIKKPEFPSDEPINLERREEKIREQWNKSPNKEYETRQRSVRISSNTIDGKTYLRNKYTNRENKMICQICKKEMPFKKRNGQYYFEAVEAFTGRYFTKEHEAQHLALCPVCAAMYKEFILHDEEEMTKLREVILNSEEPEVPIQLGEVKTTLKFEKGHFSDIKNILRIGMERNK